MSDGGLCAMEYYLQSERSPPKAVLESGNTASAGQHLHHRTTGVPLSVRRLDMDGNTVYAIS